MRFFFVEYRLIFLAYFALNWKKKKLPIFNQNRVLTPIKKFQFYDLLNFLFL